MSYTHIMTRRKAQRYVNCMMRLIISEDLSAKLWAKISIPRLEIFVLNKWSRTNNTKVYSSPLKLDHSWYGPTPREKTS